MPTRLIQTILNLYLGVVDLKYFTSLYKLLLTINIIPILYFRFPLKLVSQGNQANTTLAGKHCEDTNGDDEDKRVNYLQHGDLP